MKASQTTPQKFNHTPVRALIVDNDPDMALLVATSLEKMSQEFVTETACDAGEALAKMRQAHYSLLITDYRMPGMNGLELAQAVQEISPDIPVVLITAYGNELLQHEVERLRLAGYLDKPFNPTRLREVIQQAANGHDDTRSRRVLVLEDEDDLRRLFSKALRRAGYDVFPAATSQEARALLSRHRFDALLCDIHLDGDHATDLLRDQAPTLNSQGTQVIMVSGEVQYRGICEELGAEFFLQKPVAIGQLITLVDRLTKMERVSQ